MDSGSSAIMLDSRLAGELGLEVAGTMAAKGLAGYEELAMVRTDSISFGDLTLLGQVAGSLDLSMLASDEWEGRRFAGRRS